MCSPDQKTSACLSTFSVEKNACKVATRVCSSSLTGARFVCLCVGCACACCALFRDPCSTSRSLRLQNNRLNTSANPTAAARRECVHLHSLVRGSFACVWGARARALRWTLRPCFGTPARPAKVYVCKITSKLRRQIRRRLPAAIVFIFAHCYAIRTSAYGVCVHARRGGNRGLVWGPCSASRDLRLQN